MEHIVTTQSPDETHRLGMALGRHLAGGASLALIGPLGAGKTHLVKGIAAGNGVADPRKVTSPTFSLVHEYPGRLTLYHIDAYRLRGSPDLVSLGFEEWVRDDSAVIVEWADRVREALPPDLLVVGIDPCGAKQRRFRFTSNGLRAEQTLAAFLLDSPHPDP